MYYSPSCRREKIIGQYSKISKISSQPAPQRDTASVCFLPPSSRSLLLIPFSSNRFCCACSGKIKVSFVSLTTRYSSRKEEKEEEGEKKNRGDWVYQITEMGCCNSSEVSSFYLLRCVESCSPAHNNLPWCYFPFIFFQHKQKCFYSMLCSQVAMMSLAVTKASSSVSCSFVRENSSHLSAQMPVLQVEPCVRLENHLFLFRGLVHQTYFIWQLTNSNCNQIRSTHCNPMWQLARESTMREERPAACTRGGNNKRSESWLSVVLWGWSLNGVFRRRALRPQPLAL